MCIKLVEMILLSKIKPINPPKKAIQVARSFGWRYDNDFKLFEKKIDGNVNVSTYQELLQGDLNNYFLDTQKELLSEDDLGIPVQDLELASRHENKLVRQATRVPRLDPVFLTALPETIAPVELNYKGIRKL